MLEIPDMRFHWGAATLERVKMRRKAGRSRVWKAAKTMSARRNAMQTNGGGRGPRKSLSWFGFLLGLWIAIVSIGARPGEQAAGSQGAEAKKKEILNRRHSRRRTDFCIKRIRWSRTMIHKVYVCIRVRCDSHNVTVTYKDYVFGLII